MADIEQLQHDLGRQPVDEAQRDRTAYLTAQANALQLSAERLLGRPSRFDDEARAALGVTRAPIDRSEMEATRAALSHELPGGGSLADRYAAFRQRLTVADDRVEPVLRTALEVCRTATLAHVSLPADEGVDLVLISGTPWDGYARYQGQHRTRLEINRDAALDVTRALRLACHEGYPGHHAQYVWIDDELVRRRGWKEFLLAPAFGRHLLVAEGAAEAGVDLLFPDATREEVYRNTLLPAAGLQALDAKRIVRVESLLWRLEPLIGEIVAGYLDNLLTHAEAAERLRTEALTSNPAAVLAFAERRRTRVLAYPEGRALVHRAIRDRGLDGIRDVFATRPFAIQ